MASLPLLGADSREPGNTGTRVQLMMNYNGDPGRVPVILTLFQMSSLYLKSSQKLEKNEKWTGYSDVLAHFSAMWIPRTPFLLETLRT